MGHSAEGLQKGHKIASVVTVPNIDELKALLDDGSAPEEKAEKEQHLFAGCTQKTDAQSTLLRKVQSYVYGNGTLSFEDHQQLKDAFPMEVYTESAANITYSGNVSLGVSQLMVILNYGAVTMNDQAYVTVQNSGLSYTMDTFTRIGSAPAGYGDFNVLGLNGGAGAIGAQGGTGSPGGTGKNGNCSSAGIAGDSGTNGGGGDAGKPGGTGDTGEDGLPSMAATITINQALLSNSSFVVYTASGAGGVGGPGGNGGNGGNGGKGGDGATCGCTGSGAGSGGTGGQGGNGGQGGQGGNGVDADSNVLIYVPAAFVGNVHGLSGNAAPGAGGAGGNAGSGGSGGGAGSGGKHNGNGSGGSTGGPGTKGNSGTQGSITGKPAVISIRPI